MLRFQNNYLNNNIPIIHEKNCVTSENISVICV